MTEKPIKIEFAPGCFDNFEGTQEELDELVAEIRSMFEGKTREELEAQARPLTEEDLDDMSEEEQIRLFQSFQDDESDHRNLQ